MYKLLFAFALAGIAAAQPRQIELKDYYQIESVSVPTLSADGRKVAFVRTRIIEAENKRHSEIWVAAADRSSPPVRVSVSAVSATNPRWSPDGKLLAYSGGGEWFVHMDSPEGRPFHISGVSGPPVFSPDGRWIAFTKKIAIPKAAAPEPSEFDRQTQDRFKGRMYDWMNFRFDGRGYLPDPRDTRATPPQELFVVPVAGGEPRQLTHLGVDVLTPVWRADGQALAFIADTHQRDEYAYERADLWTVALGGQPKRITQDDGWHHLSPAWSPDGRSIAVLREEGLRRILTAKQTHGSPIDICLFPAEGGAPQNLTVDWDGLPGPPHWNSDGRSIYFHAAVKGTAHLFRLSTADGKVEQVTHGDRVLGEVSIAGDRIAYTATSSDRPVEVYTASLSGMSEAKLTSVQDALLAQWQPGKVERIRYDSKDGTSIDGWVVLPPGYNPSNGPYPLILTIHGGPHGADTSSFVFEEQLMAAAGYIVLYTNPRGSTGYGEKFLWGTWGGWGDRDFEDVMGGVDYALKHYSADPKRLGVTGYSYGGFLTNWIIGHTTRFAAAVVGAGPSDWVSNYGTGDIPRTKESEFLGSPWEPKANAVMIAHSPVTYATSIRTPTLFVHGEADERVPISQGEEMYTTLKKRQVPARFIRYPGEYHGGWSPWDMAHRYQQEMLWWKQYLDKH
ncbi:MAG TPA: S9 family peptidase [Bryobacteraceae bacterium]|nr:S9 family peptidase [Bryobacteraceae bacterium]